MRADMDRWRGQVQIGMTDLGGVLDVLSSFMVMCLGTNWVQSLRIASKKGAKASLCCRAP